MIKYTLAFAAGAAVGSTVAYIFTKKAYDGKIDEAVESVKEYNRKQIESLKNRAMKAEEMIKMLERKNEKDKVIKDAEDTANARVRTNYNALAKGYSSDILEEEEVEDEDVEDLENDNDYLEGRALSEVTNSMEGPVLISPDEFEEIPAIEPQELYYYVYDGILAAENGEIVDDIESVVGDLLETSGFAEDSEPELYIRNMLLGSEYKITKVFSSFGEV